MSSVVSHKDFCRQKYQEESIEFLINRKLLIHKQLEKPTRTYVVYSDLHGSYDKFIHWLKNGMGYYSIATNEVLGAYYSKSIVAQYEKLLLIVNRSRIRPIETFLAGDNQEFTPLELFKEPVEKNFIATLSAIEKKGLSKHRILKDLLRLLRAITRGDEHRIIKAVPPMFLENILYLYLKSEWKSYDALIEGIVRTPHVFIYIASMIVKLCVLNMVEKHINLGDTFDRGDGADKLITVYRHLFGNDQFSPPMKYLWGNHDILWMGAGIGNPILCITALRVSLRYNNLDFLDRYGFKLDKLKKFALDTYKSEPTGTYVKAKRFATLSKSESTKMTKALQVIESKLSVLYLKEVQKIPGNLDYSEDLKQHQDLLSLLPVGIPDQQDVVNEYLELHPLFSDCLFPTLQKDCPHELTAEEESIVDDIVEQFTTLPKFQDDIKWLFEQGEVYRVVDNTLYFHAAIPAKDEKLASIKGLSGKKLLDFIQRDLKRISNNYSNNKDISLREKMFFWYLWCGKDSPFFCKDKMATLERAVLIKDQASKKSLTTWAEMPNEYYKLIRNDRFLNELLMEFYADKIVMGHTPIKNLKQGILSDNLRAFIIDGGASDTYGDQGVVLINTPDFTYVTLHPSLSELKNAQKNDCLPKLKIIPLEEQKNTRLRHVDLGYFLERELLAIEELLDEKLDYHIENYFIDE
jgi:fructose-1,6-bisphosphatase-3